MYSNIPFFSIFRNHLINYPTPSTINYFWGFGALAGLALVIQIITGIFLSMHYIASTEYAFGSIEHIMRDVNFGWLIRYTHANGASFFFIVVYLHIARGLYFRSYYGKTFGVWVSGVIIFLLMMATAFFGYILPWGQMSLWGATVITNLFSAIPFFGKSIVLWLWGGFSVDNPTLMRFYTLHYLLPFIILALVLVHLTLLHWWGSSYPLKGLHYDYCTFFPYFYLKDLFGFLVFVLCFGFIIFFYPNSLGHPDNYINANPLVTPPHIVPEWYFLPFYAILRSIPNKLCGVLFMFSSIIALVFIPFFTNLFLPYNKVGVAYFAGKASVRFQFCYQFIYWVFIFSVFLLGWLGAQPAEEPFISLSLYLTYLYFFFLTFGQSISSYLDYLFLFKLSRNFSK